MKLIDKENGRSLVEVKEGNDDECYGKREYASKAVAGTALGLSIGALGIGLLRNGLFGGGLLGGGNNGGGAGSPNIAIARVGVGASEYDSISKNEQYIERKECDDVLSLTNGMWKLAYEAQATRFADRQVLNGELFGLYAGMRNGFDAINAKHNQDLFALYKGTRDDKDAVLAEINGLKTELAVMKATRPYQDALIQCDIKNVAEHADFNLWRRTCRMIEGEVVLPSTPTVTGYPSQRCCCQRQVAATPAE